MIQPSTGLNAAQVWEKKRMQILPGLEAELGAEAVGLAELLGSLLGPQEGAQASGLR